MKRRDKWLADDANDAGGQTFDPPGYDEGYNDGFNRARTELYYKYRQCVRKTFDEDGQINGHESFFNSDHILELGEDDIS